jgi:GNAT superfamily N-acetyltransferase
MRDSFQGKPSQSTQSRPMAGRMQRGATPDPTEFVAREFTPSRWADFEAFFQRYHGVQAGCWCMFYHREGPTGPLQSTDRQDANRRDHRVLLQRGRAHGVLVYADGHPVGWCQFGSREELPRVERGRKYKQIAESMGEPPKWRITCFFTDRPRRRSGIARLALHEALAAIQRRGGGIVEAYPATHGRAVATWFGTVSMFQREGFRIVRPFGLSNVLMRKEVPARHLPRRAR